MQPPKNGEHQGGPGGTQCGSTQVPIAAYRGLGTLSVPGLLVKGPHPRLLTSISKELHNPPTSNLTFQFLYYWSRTYPSTSAVHHGHCHRRVRFFWQRLWPWKLRTDHPGFCSQLIPPNATIFPAPTTTAALRCQPPHRDTTTRLLLEERKNFLALLAGEI